MKVIIVSKTQMSEGLCVGAIGPGGRPLRLLDDNGLNQAYYTPLAIGQIWDIEFRECRTRKPPHTEDILVHSKTPAGKVNDRISMHDIVKRYDIAVWRGCPDHLFDSCLLWTLSGSGYVSIGGQIPGRSTGFWIPDRNLTKRTTFHKVRYCYPSKQGWRSLPYVGLEHPVECIPAGTLVRVSLARWWNRYGETEDRCALQLSGWYGLPEATPRQVQDESLPF